MGDRYIDSGMPPNTGMHVESCVLRKAPFEVKCRMQRLRTCQFMPIVVIANWSISQLSHKQYASLLQHLAI